MTKEEAIKLLKVRIDLIKAHYPDIDDYREALGMAIEALRQEPVLDKIRAELHYNAELHEDGSYYLREEWVDEIFDMYKAESEDKE